MARFDRRSGCATVLPAILVLALAMAAGGCAGTSGPAPGEEITIEGRTFSFDEAAYPSPRGIFPEYRMAPGDVLDVLFQIRSWQEKETFPLAVDHTVSVKFVNAPELNETQRVQPDGRISLPYVGSVYVVGKTVSGLTAELRQRYGLILRDPEIYVTVPEFRSRIKELKADLHTAPRGLSRLVTVRPDGYATFPLVGDVFVADRALPRVGRDLNERYEQVLPGLHVDLFLERHAGALVYVVGRVARPDGYQIQKPITVLQALALAGGFATRSDLQRVLVLRRQGRRMVATPVDVESSLALSEGRRVFFLRPDDIVYVPRSRVAAAADVLRDIADILLFRGWNIGLDGILFDDALLD